MARLWLAFLVLIVLLLTHIDATPEEQGSSVDAIGIASRSSSAEFGSGVEDTGRSEDEPPSPPPAAQPRCGPSDTP